MEDTRTRYPVTRQIKRYPNRKLYDPVQSRYVSLSEVAAWIADGEQVNVVDHQTSEDVTVQVLTQLISEQGRRGRTFPSTLLHDLIRVGEEALHTGEEVVSTRVRRLQQTAGQLAHAVQLQVDRLKQPPDVDQRLEQLRRRIDALESQLAQFQNSEPPTDPDSTS